MTLPTLFTLSTVPTLVDVIHGFCGGWNGVNGMDMAGNGVDGMGTGVGLLCMAVWGSMVDAVYFMLFVLFCVAATDVMLANVCKCNWFESL